MRLRAISTCGALLALLGPTEALHAQSGAVAAVVQLYRAYAWEAVIDEPTQPTLELMEQPGKVLARYFDDTLTALILTDRACAARVHGECNLDFLPIWDGQDPSGSAEMKIAATADPGVVAVTFRYLPNYQMVHLSYRMTRTTRGWRIHDIVSSRGWSLLALLRRAESE